MAISADRDEIRHTRAATSHVAATSNPTSQNSARAIPRKVATPLPPLKPSQSGNRLPHHRRQRREYFRAGCQPMPRDQNRSRTFGAIAKQRCRRRPFLAGAQHIGGADIARADLAHIARAGKIAEQKPERDRAQKIAKSQGGKRDGDGQGSVMVVDDDRL